MLRMKEGSLTASAAKTMSLPKNVWMDMLLVKHMNLHNACGAGVLAGKTYFARALDLPMIHPVSRVDPSPTCSYAV